MPGSRPLGDAHARRATPSRSASRRPARATVTLVFPGFQDLSLGTLPARQRCRCGRRSRSSNVRAGAGRVVRLVGSAHPKARSKAARLLVLGQRSGTHGYRTLRTKRLGASAFALRPGPRPPYRQMAAQSRDTQTQVVVDRGSLPGRARLGALTVAASLVAAPVARSGLRRRRPAARAAEFISAGRISAEADVAPRDYTAPRPAGRPGRGEHLRRAVGQEARGARGGLPGRRSASSQVPRPDGTSAYLRGSDLADPPPFPEGPALVFTDGGAIRYFRPVRGPTTPTPPTTSPRSDGDAAHRLGPHGRAAHGDRASRAARRPAAAPARRVLGDARPARAAGEQLSLHVAFRRRRPTGDRCERATSRTRPRAATRVIVDGDRQTRDSGGLVGRRLRTGGSDALPAAREGGSGGDRTRSRARPGSGRALRRRWRGGNGHGSGWRTPARASRRRRRQRGGARCAGHAPAPRQPASHVPPPPRTAARPPRRSREPLAELPGTDGPRRAAVGRTRSVRQRSPPPRRGHQGRRAQRDRTAQGHGAPLGWRGWRWPCSDSARSPSAGDSSGGRR